MAKKKNPTLGSAQNLCLFFFFFFFFTLFSSSSGNGDDESRPYIMSSLSYPETKLKPYNWNYIRVDLPTWFSSMYLSIQSDVDSNTIKHLSKSELPLICFRDGSPPLPDVTQEALRDLVLNPLTNISFGGIRDLQDGERCQLLQKNIMLSLTNEQITPGVFYIGLFNGIGPIRTQGKMIIRGRSYTFSANVTIEGCSTPSFWGPYCNQTVGSLSCAESDGYKSLKNHSISIRNQTVENVIKCRDAQDSCHLYNETTIYYLDVMRIAHQLVISAEDIRFTSTSLTNKTGSFNGNLTCYVRHGAIPSRTLHDYSSQISNSQLIIPLPKTGRWYFAILPADQTDALGSFRKNRTEMDGCYTLDWQVHDCPVGKAGPNCTWKSYMLQTLQKNGAIVYSYYRPATGNPGSTNNIHLASFLSNSSTGDGFAWTYFHLDIPYGAAGKHLHIVVNKDPKLNYDIYSRFGGLPSIDTWDYYYSNNKSSSNGSMFFKMHDSNDDGFRFYILDVREGTWSFGLRHQATTEDEQANMVITAERCPMSCSRHGTCQSAVDASGLTLVSYCSCDQNHGGIDCSIELVDHKGHMRQSITLIASNAAAILPAYWALRQKAFSECVVFTASGISSALYHACDVGTWCALSFHVLQFMDFWLSFLAVVSNFVYLATIDEASKRVIHTFVSILTALMAATGATKSRNVIFVIIIGTVGLLIGWLIEYSTTIRSLSCSSWLSSSILERRQNIKAWLLNLLKTLRDRFRWGFVILGFLALALAGISWKVVNSKNYWIWHSIWHVSIYASSFFFLCSKVKVKNNTENQTSTAATYELARQDSFSRS
ncbi:hypothetical protein MKX01_005133 [Papaver californicum]|nr:hypothetical protein MKX01_005133 [Papaver californicum]